MAIISTFIDENWKWHEQLIGFEYIEGQHNGTRLANAVNAILQKYELQARLLSLTTDNASNNATLHAELLTHLPATDFNNILSVGIDADDKGENSTSLLTHIPCLAHIIQLALQQLLGKVHLRPTNNEFQQSWVDDKEEHEVRTTAKGLPMTLAKVSPF